MNFSAALELIKAGKKLRRIGWNGRGMYVFLGTGVAFDFGMPGDVEFVGVHDCFVMRMADGWLLPGWLAAQVDLLAEDWEEA